MDVLRTAGFRRLLPALVVGIVAAGFGSSSALAAAAAADNSAASTAESADFAKSLKEAKLKLCHSTDEYVKTVKFLRETKDFTFREEQVRKIADSVSKGCDGAASRFSAVILLLKNVGLSERRSLEMALDFSAQPPEVQKNFVEIFTNSFLAEFFDYEYANALKLAVEMSKDYKGNPVTAREDFIRLVKFCKESKSLDLPARTCADYMAKIAKSSQYYADGVAKPFLDLYGSLHDRKEFALDLKTILRVSHDILKSGPLAPQNFFEAYEFSRKDLDLDKRRALDFALSLAGRSYAGANPPIMNFAGEKQAVQ